MSLTWMPAAASWLTPFFPSSGLLASFHSLTILSSLKSFALAFPYLQSISPPDTHVACFLTLFMSLINYHLLYKACLDILILNCKQVSPHTNSLFLLQCPAFFFSIRVSSYLLRNLFFRFIVSFLFPPTDRNHFLPFFLLLNPRGLEYYQGHNNLWVCTE